MNTMKSEELEKKVIATLGIKTESLKAAERKQVKGTFRKLGERCEKALPEGIIGAIHSKGPYTPTEIVIRAGIPSQSAVNIKEKLGISEENVACSMGMSLSTFRRKKRGHQKLSVVESDRLFRMARLFVIAKEVLRDEQLAREWLQKPQYGLGGRIPLDVMQTEGGAREVEDVLGRIMHGVPS